jgi:hypothetical protein
MDASLVYIISTVALTLTVQHWVHSDSLQCSAMRFKRQSHAHVHVHATAQLACQTFKKNYAVEQVKAIDIFSYARCFEK